MDERGLGGNMDRIKAHFRKTYAVAISEKTATRLSQSIPSMIGVDSGLRMGVLGTDLYAMIPRRIDLTIGELRRALGVGKQAAKRGVA